MLYQEDAYVSIASVSKATWNKDQLEQIKFGYAKGAEFSYSCLRDPAYVQLKQLWYADDPARKSPRFPVRTSSSI